MEIEKTYPASVTSVAGTTYALVKLVNGEKRLAVQGDTAVFSGTLHDGKLFCQLTAANAQGLRERLPWLNPVPLGLQTSFGFGDRLGSATPGHIQALREVDGHGRIAPIFAQQSVRENSRIGRTPQQVMDDALWGLFQEGWTAVWGADADHVKEVAHLAPFVQAGYTFFTIDPSDHVDNAAQTDSPETLAAKATALPWEVLQTSLAAVQKRYGRTPIQLPDLTLTFDEVTLLRALAKYGRALAHAITIAHALTDQMNGKPFELEMSVDETDTPTSVHEHFFIVNELNRAGVPVVSVAPRFVGKFQKGVDYIGDVAEFERELGQHIAILDHFDNYKLSVHTGSDKFTIYPVVARRAHGRVHIKTAGTSYLEALRVLSVVDTGLFRKILDLGHERFAKDRKTYFLDCQQEKVPTSQQLSDADCPALLEDFDTRQLLHVTFGSALDVYGRDIHTALAQHEAAYDAALRSHFRRHLQPFA
jgi:hypothetical protein